MQLFNNLYKFGDTITLFKVKNQFSRFAFCPFVRQAIIVYIQVETKVAQFTLQIFLLPTYLGIFQVHHPWLLLSPWCLFSSFPCPIVSLRPLLWI